MVKGSVMIATVALVGLSAEMPPVISADSPENNRSDFSAAGEILRKAGLPWLEFSLWLRCPLQYISRYRRRLKRIIAE